MAKEELEDKLFQVTKWIETDLPEWYKDGLYKFQEVAEQILQKGFTVKETTTMLGKLYWAVSNEFG